MKDINCDGLELRSESLPVESAVATFSLGDEETDAEGRFRRVELEVPGLLECEPGDKFVIWNTNNDKAEVEFTLRSCDYSFVTDLSEVHGRLDVVPQAI